MYSLTRSHADVAASPPPKQQSLSPPQRLLERHSLLHLSTTKEVEDVFGRMEQRLHRLSLNHIKHDEL